MNFKSLIAAVALLASGVANAGLITNGDFEAGFTGWTTSGNVGLGTAGSASEFYWGAGSIARNGMLAAAFNGGDRSTDGSLYQTFATVAGARYNLTFDYGSTDNAAQSLHFAVLGADRASILNAGTVTDTDYASPLAVFNFSFVADGSTSTVLFQDVAANDTVSQDGVLDNVAVSVPEPGSLAILGLGLLGLGAARRRKQA